MIHENEIRIGILVGVGVNMSMDMVYGTILLIDGTTQSVLIESSGEKTIMTLSQLNPIPITEEILLEFGFVYNGWNYEFSDLIFHAQGKNEKGEFYNTEFGINKGGKYTVISFRIDFAHRLQNIVYDIKGQELTFKN